jgi:hypothetical protein
MASPARFAISVLAVGTGLIAGALAGILAGTAVGWAIARIAGVL